MKRCTGCRRILPFEHFGPHKGYGTLQLQARCKDCRHDAYVQKKLNQRPAYVPAKPLALMEMTQEDRRMLNQTPEAFERFFNKFADPSLGGLPAHAKVWVGAALKNKRLLLNVPPRHAKTTIMAIWFPIWQFACSRDTQILIVSKTVKHGEKIARKIAYELESNIKLVRAFGRFKPLDVIRPWRIRSGEMELEGKNLSIRSGDLNLQIRGAGQAILGMEADWVIADDVTDRRIAVSEASRNSEWDWMLGDVMSRLSPDGKAFCIGQRVHSEDIYGRLAKESDDDGTPAWHLEKTPAVLDYEEELVLWPELWPFRKLQETRMSVGASMFACMYQQTPEVAGDFVPRWWIVGTGEAETPGCLDHDRVVGSGWKNQEAPFVPITRVISIDPSPTRFAAIVVLDVVYQQRATNFYCSIVDIRRDKMGLRQMLSNIEEMTAMYRPTVCIFESNSVKWLKEDPAWNQLAPRFLTLIDHKTSVNKRDAELGVWSLASDFEAGRIRFPYGDKASRETSELLISEVLAYPNGYTDDVLMALWFTKFNYKRLLPREFLPSHFSLFGSKNHWNVPQMAMAGTWKER